MITVILIMECSGCVYLMNYQKKRKIFEPFLSGKTPFNVKRAVIESGENISSDKETAHVLNTFFSNKVSLILF